MRVWDPEKREIRFTLLGKVDYQGARFVLGGKAILSSQVGLIALFDSQTGKQIRVFRAPTDNTSLARFVLMKDGRHFISVDKFDGYLRLWNLETGEELYNIATHATESLEGKPRATEVQSMAVTPDGRDVLLGLKSGEIIHWRLPTLPPSK